MTLLATPEYRHLYSWGIGADPAPLIALTVGSAPGARHDRAVRRASTVRSAFPRKRGQCAGALRPVDRSVIDAYNLIQKSVWVTHEDHTGPQR
jgi:hypothetical protein